MQRKKTEDARVLVCISSSPSNQRVIRSAARFAQGSSRSLTALYVDNSSRHARPEEVRKNLALAEASGASIEIIARKDVLGAIMDFVREQGITDLFIGYSGPSRSMYLHHLPVYRLVHQLPEVDIHIIPDAQAGFRPSALETNAQRKGAGKDILTLAAVMTVATGISFLFYGSPYSNGNIITVYILAVLITAAWTAQRIYGIAAAVLYILLFNFLFIDPRFSFLVYDPEYMVTYLVSIIAAVITGNISSKMKQSSLQARMNAYQAQVLLNASELLQKAENMEEIGQITSDQLGELLRRRIVFFRKSGSAFLPQVEETAELPSDKLSEYNSMKLADSRTDRQDASSGKPSAYGSLQLQDSRTDRQDAPESIPSFRDEQTRRAFEWTAAHNQRAGWGTRHFPESEYQFLSVRTGNGVYGITGVSGEKGMLDSFEENILLSLIGECALSMEAEKNRQEREAALIVMENERFRSKLLRSISHDLRTPLTSISGNAVNLMDHAEEFSEEERARICSDIYEDSIWLIDLVENLLSITKLEEHVEIHPTGEVVADVLATALSRAQRHRHGHTILLEPDDECLVAWMDVQLILQVLGNLIGNAIKHTPAGTRIVVSDRRDKDTVIVTVSDDGPGISEEDMPHIFELFYTGKKAGADSSRSLGLGLNLCRSIIEAHGQQITVSKNEPRGVSFCFALKLWKETDHETVSYPDR